MTTRRRLYMLTLCAGALFLLLGCTLNRIGMRVTEIGDLQRDSVTVGAEEAESVRVQIRMGAGELDIRPGAEELMEAEFAYNVQAWEPIVTYDVQDGVGRLIVRQPSTDRISVGRRMRYEWDLRFSDATPLDMRIEAGAGRQSIDLTGLRITRLSVTMGAGDAEINVSDNPELERLDFDLGVGRVNIDMRGPWDHNADVTVQGGVGSTTLRLPNDVGVRAEVTSGLGGLDTSGLRPQDGAWVNDAYDTSEVTLFLRIRAGVGNITLEVED
jgi:hypothetical protein